MSFYSDCKKYKFYDPRQLFKYLFPKEGDPELSIDHFKWGKNLATLNPLLSVTLIAFIFLWPTFLVRALGLHPGFGFILGYVSKISAVLCLLSLLFFLIFAYTLSKKKRSPKIPLALTILTPLQFTIGILSISLMGYLIIPKSDLLTDTAKCKLVKKAYITNSKMKKLLTEKFWGFELGVDTYGNVINALNIAEANYEISGYLNNHKLPIIKVHHSSNFSPLGPIAGADLHFDSDKKLFSIVLNLYSDRDVDSLSNRLISLFKSKYQYWMDWVGLQNERNTFFTPSRVKIQVLDSKVELILPEQEATMNLARKKIEIEQGSKLSHLIY